MNTLIILISPFTALQYLTVINDKGTVIRKFSSNLLSLTGTTLAMAKEFECTDIKLKGVYNFAAKYAQEMKEFAAVQYADTNFNIEVI